MIYFCIPILNCSSFQFIHANDEIKVISTMPLGIKTQSKHSMPKYQKFNS
jgi:hypothetical protein